MKSILSRYSLNYPRVLVYMLQSTEYQAKPYLKWFWRTKNFNTVMRRRQLDLTLPAKMLLIAVWGGIFLQIVIAVTIGIFLSKNNTAYGWLAGLVLIFSYPFVWAHLAAVPLALGRFLIIRPRESRLVKASKQIFHSHPGVKIAVAGSYGKTTMKELLLTVLGEGKKVAATPANKNVAVSHAAFAANLTGDEDVLIIEYGEGRPGDVAKFAETTRPTLAVITGVAPAHLDHYPTLEAAGADIFSLSQYVDSQAIYANGESPAALPFIKGGYHVYSEEGIDKWQAKNVNVDIQGIGFTLSKGKQSLKLTSGLLGRHQIGPLCAIAAIALELGLTVEQVEHGVSKTAPFEHRMQPRQIGGAWVIDDTYNGNIDGIRAGLELLKELPAKRKIYITPGLVDQGIENENVHTEMGSLIAVAQPDRVILMENSATQFISKSLVSNGFKGDVHIENDPLEFYTNLDKVVAAGDLVLMQNDWTDNYA